LLLDTCTFLWLALDSPELSGRAREIFADPANKILLSTVSVWEITLKYAMGRLPLPAKPELYVPSRRKLLGVHSLALEEEAVLQLPRLSDLHRDPFDRMLICQAIAHGMPIITPDAQISRYPIRVIW
jgi:PIN domain nuclease of toxin-antitoxin system